ncbi:Putative NAD-dependent epimerase/dehydratase, NAD(P)-binding domain superfamily [Colletotrichum destructivum]|uniref:NAD-dependent epimerase/dehydratase, NAD(P)-binding domain superfamily n=1 Tax=Colletotrichum destructivum TaxID=34406 RepID=A0AAX4IQA7_9PEZI|nr:Putative NAD-dependent epimerase/dehydratase, NAD(P)-binding domain superfamily [Colletotrichum destructivum]
MAKSLVTGGTGFIGLYVVKLLLERGHRVHTTVRSLKNTAKCKPLLDLQAQYPNSLSLFEADLLENGSFRKAMEDCEVVYHIASPFLVPQQIKDGLKDCVEPALQGTKSVLESANKVESVKRVVLTSSVAAMYGDNADVLKENNGTLTESCWNSTSSRLQDRWSLVVVNPGMVLGPSLTPESVSGSHFMLEALFRGDNRMGCADLSWPLVDVRDVAEAHVMAGEDVSATGRYIVSGDRTVSLLEMADLVRPVHRNPRALPGRNLPKLMVYMAGPFIGITKKWTDANVGIPFKVDNSRSIEQLGMKYRSAEEACRSFYESWQKKQKVC